MAFRLVSSTLFRINNSETNVLPALVGAEKKEGEERLFTQPSQFKLPSVHKQASRKAKMNMHSCLLQRGSFVYTDKPSSTIYSTAGSAGQLNVTKDLTACCSAGNIV